LHDDEITIDDRPGIDWAAIGDAYRNGGESIRAIARLHGISDAAVRKRAKAGSWVRSAARIIVRPAPRRPKLPPKPAPKRQPARMRVVGDAAGNGHFVYVIHEAGDDQVCKVGISGDPRGRLLQLQTATWHRLILAAAFRAGDPTEAAFVERAVHQSLSGLHLSGEWFRVSAEKASSEIVACAAAGGVQLAAATINDKTLW
jgi:hypothetical protein